MTLVFLNADPARTSGSFSTFEKRSARSNTISPSVGSFQVQLRKPQRGGQGIERLSQNEKQMEPVETGDLGVQNSPKRKRGAQKNLDLDSIDEQQRMPRSMENVKNKAVAVTSPGERNGVEAEAVKSTPKRKKAADEGDPMEGEAVKSTPKRKRGASKVVPVEPFGEARKVSTRLDDFESESEDEGAVTRRGSGSLKAEAQERSEREDHHSSQSEEELICPSKPDRKKGRNGKAKVPVSKRVSVSRVTRAAKACSTK